MFGRDSIEKFKLSLKKKAIIAIIAILIPILVSFVLVYCHNRVYLKNRILDTLTVIAEAYEGQVYQFLEIAKIRTWNLASDSFIRTHLQNAIRGNTPAINALNKHLAKSKRAFDKTINNINILALDGRVVASTSEAEIGRDLSGEACFEKSKNAVTILENRTGHVGLPEITLSTTIFNKEQGRPIGVIVNYILLSELNNLLTGEYVKDLGVISWGKGKGVWQTMEVYLVNGDKRMITKSLFVKDAILKQAVDTLPVNLSLASGKEMAGFYKDYRGTEVAGASMCIPSMKWTLLIEIDKSEVIAPIKYILTSSFTTASVVIIMIALLIFGFIKKMVLPIRKISEAAKNIAGGNFDVIVPVQTQDEIGVLCESFNYMTDHINTRTMALVRSEARLAEAQRIARLGNWEWDVIKNEVSWSCEAYRIFGLIQEKFVSSYEMFMNFIHPEDREMVKKSFDNALHHKKSLDVDHRIILKDASVRIVQERAVVISDKSGNAVKMTGTVQDITERKRTEEEMGLLKTLTLSISESKDLHDALVITLEKVCNATGWIYGEAWMPNPEGECLERAHAFYCKNEGLEKFSKLSGTFTFPPDAGLPGRVWSRKKPLWIPDVTMDPNYPRAAIANEVGLKAGVAFPVFSDMEIVAVLVFYMYEALEKDERLVSFVSSVLIQLREIIKRKKTEESLRIEKNKLQSIIDAMEDGLTIQDLDYNIVYQNKYMKNIFGVQLGKKCYSIYEGKNTICNGCPVALVYEDGKPHSSERRIVMPSGEIAFLENIASPIKDDSGKIVYCLEISRNITGRKQAEETKTRLSEITETTTDFVGTATIDGSILYINKAGRKVIGIGENEDISNLRISDCHPQWASDLILNEGIPDAIREGAWLGETAFLSRDGREIPFSQVIIVHKNTDGTVRSLSTIGRDISERKRFEEQIMYMSNRDPLTNLLNRRRFHEELEGWLAQARRFKINGALLFLDMDNFKYINDSLGHQAGDKLLITMAGLLKERLRETDILARLGGDEFAIILPHADADLAESVANQIRELVQYYSAVAGEYSPGITASIGIAMFPGHGDTTETLLAHADLAMYRAKEEGRNRVYIYTPEQKSQIESRLMWEKRIREALNRDSFILYMQPILDIRKNRIIGHEALLRMVSEKGEIVTPPSFLHIAERFGLICEIDRWVVIRAINLIKELQQNNKPTYLEVNLSAKTFTDAKLLPLIRREITATGIDPATIVFEITETSLIENINAAQRFITDLKLLGCRFALDDFGIGFSSFNYIKHLPVDYLKIDGSFIRNLPHDTMDQHLVKAMVEVARGLEKKTIAESVENEETLSLIREYGIDYAQGYHIGKPCHMSELRG